MAPESLIKQMITTCAYITIIKPQLQKQKGLNHKQNILILEDPTYS